jgi:hypothetical protein
MHMVRHVVRASEVFLPHELPDFFLSSEFNDVLTAQQQRQDEQGLPSSLFFRRSEMWAHPDAMLADAFAATAFSSIPVLTVHTSKVSPAVTLEEMKVNNCDCFLRDHHISSTGESSVNRINVLYER